MTGERRQRASTPATKAITFGIVVGLGFEILTGAWSNGEVLRVIGANLPMASLHFTGEYWRLLTSMFLHGNGTVGGTLLHLAVNVIALYSFGGLFEMMFGTRRFVLIYFGAGITASIASAYNLLPWGLSVGASGAVAGILGAMVSSIYRSPQHRRDPRQRSIAGQTIFWILANVALALEMQKVETAIRLDHAAHLGGLLMGLLLGALLPHRPPPPPSPRTAIVDVQPYEN